MAYAAIGVAGLALAFTIASFWWLHARGGSLTGARPLSFAFAPSPKVRLRLPVAFYNTGAKALIVTDLRVVLDDEPTLPPLDWITTRAVLRPESDDGFAFATPFAVQGRSTREVIAEFGDDREWRPLAGIEQKLRLQGHIHPSSAWIDLATFDWWPPPDTSGAYITHRNRAPSAESTAERRSPSTFTRT
jgi:hypothetical protein